MQHSLFQKTEKFFAAAMMSLACWFLLGVTVVALKTARQQAGMTGKYAEIPVTEEQMTADEEVTAAMPVEKAAVMLKTYAVARH